MIVYKYLSFENAVKAILNNTLIASHFDEYNDPFEAMIFNKPIHEDEDQLDDYSSISEGSTLRNEMSTQIRNNVRSSCFSRSNKDILLWSHYADNHKGIVICYSTTSMVTPLLKPQFKDIRYNGEMVKIFKGTNDITFKNKLRASLTTKSKIWSYEEEVRLIFENNDDITKPLDTNPNKCVLPISSNSLISIYFGCRSPTDSMIHADQKVDWTLLHKYISLRSNKEYSAGIRSKPINQYRCIASKKHYALSVKQIISTDEVFNADANEIRIATSKPNKKSFRKDLLLAIKELEDG